MTNAQRSAYGMPAPAGHVTIGYAISIIRSHDHEAYHTADGLLAISWARHGVDQGEEPGDSWYQEPVVFPAVDDAGQATGSPYAAFVRRSDVMAWLGY